MRKLILCRAMLCIGAATGASAVLAQSPTSGSVTVSGLLDLAVSSVSNQTGNRVTRVQDGSYLPSKISFRGNEDIGDGTQAIFDLSIQFTADTGALLPGKGLFDNTAYVGLANARIGRLTLGHQNDFAFDYIFIPGNDPAKDVGGLLNMRQGPFTALGIPTTAQLAAVNSPIPGNQTGAFSWDRTNGVRMPNSIKASSAPVGGLSFGAMYSMGEVAGSTSKSSGSSFGARYDNGPHGAAVVYTYQKYPTFDSGNSGIRNLLAGGHYQLGDWTLVGLYSNARNTATDAFVHAAQVGATYRISPAWTLGGTYARMNGNAKLNDNRANQYAMQLSCYMSKRTMLYMSWIAQDTNAAARALLMSTGPAVVGASSDNSQNIITLGIGHRF